VGVICESKWWIEVKDGEYRHYACWSRSSRCGERHGWMIRRSQGAGSWWRVAKDLALLLTPLVP